jgi:hypothetical protein
MMAAKRCPRPIREKVPETDQRPQCSQYPDDGGGSHPDDRPFTRQDDPATDEADAGDHLSQYARGIDPFSHERGTQAHKQLGTHADQNAGTDAGGLPSKLPLQSDDTTAQHGRAQAKPELRALGIQRIEGGYHRRIMT